MRMYTKIEREYFHTLLKAPTNYNFITFCFTKGHNQYPCKLTSIIFNKARNECSSACFLTDFFKRYSFGPYFLDFLHV